MEGRPIETTTSNAVADEKVIGEIYDKRVRVENTENICSKKIEENIAKTPAGENIESFRGDMEGNEEK